MASISANACLKKSNEACYTCCHLSVINSVGTIMLIYDVFSDGGISLSSISDKQFHPH